MSALELKTELHQLIDQVNDNGVLRAIQTILQKQVEKDEGAIDSRGKSLSLKAFIKKIEKAEAEVKAGKYVTIAQLEKESEKW
jgi:hypothetical protein